MIGSIQAQRCCMTGAMRVLKLPTTVLSISCGIYLISFLMLSLRTSVVSGLFRKLCLSGMPTENSQGVEIWGIGWPGVIGLRRNEFVPQEVLPEVFKSSV